MSNKQVEMSPIEDVVAAIARGEMIVMVDDEDRENEGDLIMAAQFATPEKIAFIVRHTSGVVVAPLSGERCDDLRLPLMVDNNTESHRTAFTISVDLLEGTTTGISAADRAATLRGLADPNVSSPRTHLPVARPRRRSTEARWTHRSRSRPCSPCWFAACWNHLRNPK
jgi:3,4-dihydroxy 2-butanone 4-phosphate synthase/GTP cyclohydrolase II